MGAEWPVSHGLKWAEPDWTRVFPVVFLVVFRVNQCGFRINQGGEAGLIVCAGRVPSVW